MGSLQTITEMILFSFAIIGIFGIMAGVMEMKYPGHLNIPSSDNTNTSSALVNSITGAKTTLDQGDVNFDSQSGLTNPSVWGILYSMIGQIWSFISGSWIRDWVSATQLGGAGSLFATALQALWFVVLIGIAVFTFLKVRSV